MNFPQAIRLFVSLSVISIIAGCDNTFLSTRNSKPIVSDQEEFTRQIEVPDNVRVLEFHHRGGNLTVVGWENPYILVEGVTRATAETVQMARSIIEMVEVIAYEQPVNRLILDYEGPAGFAPGKIPEEGLDYTAHVPKDMLIDLRTETGSVAVSNIENNVFIEHSDGDVRAESVTGNVTIDLTGKKGQGRRIDVKDVGRNLVLDAHYADVEIEKAGGEADIDHDNGELRVSDVGGKLTLKGNKSAVEIHRVQGFLQIDNTGGDVVCNGFYDGIHADLRKGTLRLEPKVPVTRSYDCTVDNGNLIFRVPDDSNMLLEIMAVNGSIHSEYPLQVSAENKISTAKGAIGRGFPNVRLGAERGNISILRAIPVPNSSNASTNETNTADSGESAQPLIPVSDLQPADINR